MYSKNKLLDVSGKHYLMVDRLMTEDENGTGKMEDVIILQELCVPERLFAVKEEKINNGFSATIEEEDQPLIQRAYRHWRGNLYYLKNKITFVEDYTTWVLLQELFGENKVILKPVSEFLELVPPEYKGSGVTKQTYKFELFEGVQLYVDELEGINLGEE